MKKLSARAKIGSWSVLLTVLVIAGAILINLVAGTLTDRFSLKYDMTKTNIYELSNETISMLGGLKTPVTITVVADEATFAADSITGIISEILKRYQSASNGSLKVQYVDPYKNPAFTKSYSDLTLSMNDLLIESEKRHESIGLASLFETSADQSGANYIEGIAAEQKLTSAINLVTRESLPKALIISGHNEQISNAFMSLLTQSNYDVDTINLAMESVPEDVSLLIEGAPAVDFSGEEIEKLDQYLKKGGDMIFLAGTTTPTVSNLEAYFEKWGVRFPKVAVFDSSRTIGHPLQIAPYPTDSELTQTLLSRADTPILTPFARQIELLPPDGETGATVVPALVTSTKGYGKAYTDEAGIDSFDKSPDDEEGQFVVGALSQMTQTGADGAAQNSRILFLGSSVMINDEYLNTPGILNSYFFVNAFSYLDEQGDSVLITPKKLISPQMNMTGSVAFVLAVVLAAVIPLFVAVIGFYQWRRRRNL